MPASIAHEVRQPLAAIVISAMACRRWRFTDPTNLHEARAAISRLVRDATAAIDIVNQIDALFKQAAPNKSPVDINDINVEVCRTMREETEPGFTITADLDETAPSVMADRRLTRQVLINLIRNGLDAMAHTPFSR